MYLKKFLMAGCIVVPVLLAVLPSPLHATVSWTVMVYMDGDNNLEPAAIDDFNEMEAVGSTAHVDVVVQIDRHAAYDNSNGDWTNTKRFHITKDGNGYDNTIVSTEVMNMSEINMGDPSELIDFITWAQSSYPANQYLLVLWDHGSGWKGSTEPVKSVCYDETDSDSLSIAEVNTALRTVTSDGDYPLDIVGFDACYMGMVEIDYDIMPYAHYRVGSEEYEPGDGWNYLRILDYITHNPFALPRAFSQKIVDTYINSYGRSGYETQSAVHLNPTGSVVETLDVFALHLAGAMQYRSEIEKARTNVEAFSDLDYIDLYHFAQLISTYVPHKGIQKDAHAVKNAVTEAVVAEGHGYMNYNAHGMSIYFPSTSAGYQTSYENALNLSDDTFWDEFLLQYYNPSYCLDATLTAAPGTARSTEIVTVSMDVTNNAGNTVTSVTPSPLTVISTGTACAVLTSGPVPLTADLTAGDSSTFLWQYLVLSGTMGGTLTFSGNASGKDSVSQETVFSPLVLSNTVIVPGPNQSVEEVPDYNEQMQPVANTRIQVVEAGLEALQQQFAAAESEGKDTTPCEELLELVEEYLQRAQENYEKGNYIAANYWALQATNALEEAEECLKNL